MTKSDEIDVPPTSPRLRCSPGLVHSSSPALPHAGNTGPRAGDIDSIVDHFDAYSEVDGGSFDGGPVPKNMPSLVSMANGPA